MDFFFENQTNPEFGSVKNSELLLLTDNPYPEMAKGASHAKGMNKSLGKNISEIISPTFSQDTATNKRQRQTHY